MRIAVMVRVPQRSLKRVKNFVSPSVTAELWGHFFAMAQVKQIAGVMAVVRVTKRHHQGDGQFGALELDVVPFLANKPVRWMIQVSDTFDLILVGKPPVVCLSRYHKGIFLRRQAELSG